jgi:hypothetical protein
MNAGKLLALYDADERRDAVYFDTRREASPRIVRHVSLFGGRGAVIHWNLTGADVEAAIAEQIAYFESIGQDFEWKVYAHDAPEDLGTRLSARGFEPEDEESIVFLDASALPERLSASAVDDVEHVSDPAGVDEIITMMESVWHEDLSDLRASLRSQLGEDPRHLGVYVRRVDAAPASAGWIRFRDGSHFASLWGGTTVPAHRERGLYTSLVAARALEALGRDAGYLTVDATPMSRPILEKLGFRVLTRARGYIWKVAQRKPSRDGD